MNISISFTCEALLNFEMYVIFITSSTKKKERERKYTTSIINTTKLNFQIKKKKKLLDKDFILMYNLEPTTSGT